MYLVNIFIQKNGAPAPFFDLFQHPVFILWLIVTSFNRLYAIGFVAKVIYSY